MENAAKISRNLNRSCSIILLGMFTLVGDTSSRAADPSPPPPIPPVRVSRTFFQEKKLEGNLIATAARLDLHLQVKSPIDWTEAATTQPAPKEGALADFRDHTGCAQFKNTNDVAVCFKMMGDVFSLGVNAREMQLQGIQDYLKEAVQRASISKNCSYEVQNLKLSQASRNNEQVNFSYEADLVPSDGCEGPTDQVALQFQIRAS